jgi:signal transduction histidine kinase
MEQAHHNSILAHPTMLPGEGDTTVELSTVTTCLSEIEALVKSTWQSNIRFDLQASHDMPAVPCSRMELQSALMNLLINARDAMPGGGAISLAAAAIYEAQTVTGIEIRVADNGFGMSHDTLLHATDPFFTTKTTGLGGLGLPMVMRFAQEAGGRMHIESEPGRGTIVTLRLSIPGSNARRNPARR